MEYISTAEIVEGFSWLFRTPIRSIDDPLHLVKVTESLKLLIVVSKLPCSLSVKFQACHIDLLHEYSGGLQRFLNAFTMCSKHKVREWRIFCTLVKVRGSWKLLIVVRKVPC